MKLTIHEANRSNQETNRHLLRLKVALVGILGILLFITIYIITSLSWQSGAQKGRHILATKVTAIMRLYNCNDREIHTAIMATFDPLLVAIIIGVESEYHPGAISPAGCRGLMQLSPDKLSDWRNVAKNIRTGASFLREQLRRFGSIELAIAAYNAGPENVSKYKGIPPFRETIHYLNKTRSLCSEYYPELFPNHTAKLPMTKYHWRGDSDYARVFKSGLFDPAIH